ncbi:metallopeptidase family protein [uncultured Tessaracoccus sp.]|uniref:metallopeptidase family protein n=1 Tax=uncultured Tessaracoccus sp. TaxID=905023 RepID=UPI00262BDD51|nr:metallopeptidase family protein [uncultured Tessaracoccus sp.]
MPRRRDRHGRGFRGPLTAPGSPARLNRAQSRQDFFSQCVRDAIAAVLAHDALALDDVMVAVEEVPYLNSRWSGERVPLSAGVEADQHQRARVVLYERPLEHRASSPVALKELVHRTLVEQLATLTGRSIDDLGGHANWG